ncbi:MAG: hypothetical protein J6Q54_08230, partial [Oscillospiraceae bacterium]|nr:hypothetical protein [Oscillospiraceae bacterium]
MECFSLLYNGVNIGEVEVYREGLYYRIKTRFKISQNGYYQLCVWGDSGVRKLGLCVPYGEIFGTEVTIPSNRILGEIHYFFLEHKGGICYHPVFEDRPFRYLKSLEKAFLIFCEGSWQLATE